MTETEQLASPQTLPGDPAGLLLSLRVEHRAGNAHSRGVEEWALLVRHDRLPAGQAPRQPTFRHDLEHVGTVGILRVPLSKGTITQDVYDELTGRTGEPSLDQELCTAVAQALFTRRSGQVRLSPAVRETLEKSARHDLGDLLVVYNFSIESDWAALDVLLLGEAVFRAAASGPCFLSTAPAVLRSTGGYQPTLRSLRAAGFRPLVDLAMVAPTAGLPRLGGPAGRELIRTHRQAG